MPTKQQLLKYFLIWTTLSITGGRIEEKGSTKQPKQSSSFLRCLISPSGCFRTSASSDFMLKLSGWWITHIPVHSSWGKTVSILSTLCLSRRNKTNFCDFFWLKSMNTGNHRLLASPSAIFLLLLSRTNLRKTPHFTFRRFITRPSFSRECSNQQWKS